MDSASEAKLSQVNPTLANIIRQMAADIQSRGGTLRVVSGLRSYAQQAALYANRASNKNPVAAPGTSKHERVLAVDLTWGGVSQSYVGQLGESLGLRWGGRFNRPDPGHFELGAASAAPDDDPDSPFDFLPSLDNLTPESVAPYLLGAVVLILVVRVIRG